MATCKKIGTLKVKFSKDGIRTLKGISQIKKTGEQLQNLIFISNSMPVISNKMAPVLAGNVYNIGYNDLAVAAKVIKNLPNMTKELIRKRVREAYISAQLVRNFKEAEFWRAYMACAKIE